MSAAAAAVPNPASARAGTRPASWTASRPPAVAASIGCANPAAAAALVEGEVVLDLGSGGGIDVLLSARRVGSTGKAYGLDMTDEMLALARANQSEAGVDNAEFLKGHMEAIPLPAASVDVVLSNCVIAGRWTRPPCSPRLPGAAPGRRSPGLGGRRGRARA